jgi:MoaA/NifB/PqqE/SkfB family radical SAM enzyme
MDLTMKDFSNASWVDPSLGWRPHLGSEHNNAIDSVTGVMDIEASKRLIEEMAPAHPLIQPNMYGEPMLVPNLRERLEDMRARGISIAMNTNGLTLDDDLAKFMVDIEVDAISFSIDAVSRATLMKIALTKLKRSKLRCFACASKGARRKPCISVSLTVQDANRHEEEEFVKRWSGLVDCVRVGLLFENGTFPDMVVPEKRLINDNGEPTVRHRSQLAAEFF